MSKDDILDLIGDVHSEYIAEAQSHREEKNARRSPVKIILLAAALAVFLTGCAYAVLRLQNLKLGEYTPPALPTETQSVDAGEVKNRDIISLQGFDNSPNFQATKEWITFRESYDPDRALMKAADQSGFAAPEEYISYNCYTQEMVDKIDEICHTYKLKPLGICWTEQMNIQAMFDLLGIRGITGTSGKNIVTSGRYYQSGSFGADGEVTLSSLSHKIYYQFHSAMKNTLDYVSLNVGNIGDFKEWSYKTQNGTEVLLALSSEKALILADRDDCFISVNILNPSEGESAMTAADLEAVADTFDLTYQAHPVDPAAGNARQQAEEAEFQAEQDALAAQWNAGGEEAFWAEEERKFHETYRKTGYAEFIQDSLKDPVRKNARYLLQDVTGDGIAELMLQYEKKNESNETYTETCVMTLRPDGLTDCILLSNCEVFKNGVFGYIAESDMNRTYDYFRLDGTKNLYESEIRCGFAMYDRAYGWVKAVDNDYVSISEAEAEGIISAYVPLTSGWQPISEFPMQ